MKHKARNAASKPRPTVMPSPMSAELFKADLEVRNNHSHRSDKPAPVHVAVYDGTDFVGQIDEHRDGRFRALDVNGKLIGTFTTQRDAMRSIPAVRA